MIEALLKKHSGELIGALTGAGGLDTGEAKSLLPPAISGIGDVLGSGNLDVSKLLGSGGAAELLGKLDLAGIAASAGLNEGKAQSGLSSLIPVVVSLLGEKAGGADGLLSMLGRGSGGGSAALGAIGGIAGKLFGR